jgi:hypothetical protein
MSTSAVSPVYTPPETDMSEAFNAGDIILTFATEEFITPKFVNGEEEENEEPQ